jgi:predicted transcriptional regulator of viral defense system
LSPAIMKNISTYRIEQARKTFERHGGAMRTHEALQAGIHREVLYAMRDTGLVEPLARGLYRLVESRELGNPDLVTVAMKMPKGVICMVSALSHHRITTQIPHAVDVALVRGSEPPRLKRPPIHIYWSVEHILACGAEQQNIDGKHIRIHNPERALVDAFRYRNKIGFDVAMEALRLYRERLPLKVDRIMEYAAVCRITGVIRPYLEGTL